MRPRSSLRPTASSSTRRRRRCRRPSTTTTRSTSARSSSRSAPTARAPRSLGTFDSTSTSLNVGQTGSAAVPGPFNLQTATQYWWRAKNVDSSTASSSFSSTRSFTVDTTRADRHAPRVTTGRRIPGSSTSTAAHTLWLNATQSGDFSLTAAATDVQSGIAGVDFPAIFGTGASSDPPQPVLGGLLRSTAPGRRSASGAAVVHRAERRHRPGGEHGAPTRSRSTPTPRRRPPSRSASPADLATVRNNVTVSAAPTDAAAPVSARSTSSTATRAGGPCVPVDPDRRDADGPGARHLLRHLGEHRPHRRPQLRGRRGRDRQRRPHDALGDQHRRRRQQRADRRGRGTDRRLGRRQYQHYDAPSKTLWLNATQDGPVHSSRRTPPTRTRASRPSTSRRFLGTSASSDASAPYASSTYSFSLAVGTGRADDHGDERRHRPVRRDEHRLDHGRRRRRRAGDEHAVPAQQRLLRQHDAGTPARRLHRHAGERHLRHRRRRRLRHRLGAALDQGPHDGQVLRRRGVRAGDPGSAAHGDARRHATGATPSTRAS